MALIKLTKTPDMLFSKSLTRKKYVLHISSDLTNANADHLSLKKDYLNYAYMVLLYAEWQNFIKTVFYYGVKLIIKKNNLTGIHSKELKKKYKKEMGSFGNPTTRNIDRSAKKLLGITNISNYWAYDNYTAQDSQKKLNNISKIRNEIAHSGEYKDQLSPDICFDYMEHLYQLSVITRKVIDTHVN